MQSLSINKQVWK